MKSNKDKVITLRLTPEQHQLFQSASISDERSLCEWLRRVATKAAVAASANPHQEAA